MPASLQTIFKLALSTFLEKNEIPQIPGLVCHQYTKNQFGQYIDCEDGQAIAVGMAKREDILGLHDFDILNADEAGEFKKNDLHVMQTRSATITHESFTTFSGQAMLATSIKTPLFSDTKKPIGVIGLSILRENNCVAQTPFKLTPRELDCLYYLVKGNIKKEIAKQLKLSERTVEHYLESAKNKMMCSHRSELISKALLIPQIREKIFIDIL
jgi:DNA-binding CsgD family transcriptional regulator